MRSPGTAFGSRNVARFPMDPYGEGASRLTLPTTKLQLPRASCARPTRTNGPPHTRRGPKSGHRNDIPPAPPARTIDPELQRASF